jgi:hypothetical protein
MIAISFIILYMDANMKFKIFRLILCLCLTAIFMVYLYTENTGDNACYNKSLECNEEVFGK